VPIAIVEANDAQSLEYAIIENVQRTDLNPIEEATGYLALMDDFNRTQEEVAQIVGKSRPHVANTIRLLKLSEPVKQLVRTGKISAGHARLLVGQPNAELIAHEIIDNGWSVRDLEADMRKDVANQLRDMKREAKGFAVSVPKDPDTRALERRLSNALGLDVSVDHRGDSGTLRIKYRNLEQLDAVLRKLGN
jgi:ParB family chromosome partitioning protein